MQSSELKKKWLLAFCALVILMITVGGITRMTRSGLSIVEWKPIAGIIPPLSENDWANQFELYKQSPEYQKVNSHFEISDYKKIFLWEYSHRVLGRLLFLFIVLPGFFLWRKKLVSGKLVVTLALLVALQGLIGWLMVKTGLNVNPHVSPYMLALHFFSALIVLLVPYHQVTRLRHPERITIGESQMLNLRLFGLLLGLQIFYGCLTSGLKAGIGYNTYPLMNGSFMPGDAFALSPSILNFFENPGLVQWTHRWIGIAVLLGFGHVLHTFRKSSTWPHLAGAFLHLTGLLFLQVALGILNILYVVPISLASMHQLCATFLVLGYFSIVFRAKSAVEPA
jgi:cytochrome c oxidase assembly protein subunit 15